MVSTERMLHLADLSKLHFNEAELEQLKKDLSDIIELMDEVQNFNGNPNRNETVRSFAQQRPDTARDSFPCEEILKNAKGRTETFFSVPKVVE